MSGPSECEPIAIAVVGRPRGLRGECRLSALGRTLETIGAPCRVLVGREGAELRPLVLTQLQPSPRGFIGRFEGIEDCEAAGQLRNVTVYLERASLPPLGEREYYHFELKGLRVVADDGGAVGTVREVHNYPTMDALEVERDDGGTWLLPMSASTVAAVERQEGVIRVYRRALEELL